VALIQSLQERLTAVETKLAEVKGQQVERTDQIVNIARCLVFGSARETLFCGSLEREDASRHLIIDPVDV
jgi:hypothetical protein